MEEDLLGEIYAAIAVLEDSLGFLSPYAPTPEQVMPRLVETIDRLLASKVQGRQPVLYEPGCGRGVVAAKLAESLVSKPYYLCLELDEGNVEEARRTCHGRGVDYLVDIVQGDLRSFRPRRVDAVYAYLLPGAVKVLEEELPQGTIIVSLDYTGSKPPMEKYSIAYHEIYVIET